MEIGTQADDVLSSSILTFPIIVRISKELENLHKNKITYNPITKVYSFQSFHTFIPLFSKTFISTTHIIFVTKQNILRTFSHVF